MDMAVQGVEVVRKALGPAASALQELSPYELLDAEFVLFWTLVQFAIFFVLGAVCAGLPIVKQRPLLASYCLVSLLPVVWLSVEGVLLFAEPMPATVEERTFAPLDGASRICMIQITYQIFGIGAAILVGQPLLTAIMMVHHVCTMALGFANLAPFVHYHIIFFGGIIELSNIPLTIMDIFKYFPDLQRVAPSLNSLCRYSFAILFLVLRVALWIVYGARFHLDCIHVLQNGLASSPATVVLNQVLNLILTSMQLLWASKVVKGLAKALGLVKKKEA